MTSREIVLANLHRSGAERPGLNFNRGRLSDFAGCGLGPSPSCQQKRWTEGQFEDHDDEWGNVWYRMADGSQGGEIYEPALKDWGRLDSLELPDMDHPSRFEGARVACAEAGDRFRLAFVPGWVFASSRYLRRMEVYFIDLIEHREEIDRLHGMVTDLLVRVIRQFGEAGADGIFYCEDLGTQDRVLIGPPMWRDIFRPHYERLTRAAHDYGMKVFMHSCGYNWDLIDDLVAAGVDCLQFDQPSAYDMPALAEKLRGHGVALYSPVDIQKVMPTGDRALIESEAERLVELFRGALICKNYPDLAGIGVQEEWDDWAYQAILRACGVTAP